ncbi:MAG: response regulator [Pseudomonadota bacterium]
MTAKRALVVDDSKSARAFLSALLEANALEVDAAETAEQAIDYLTRHRPDVIFMDHLMPGMDGFQAVQAIKSNPRTATIPILMYTSQEGELYVGQARALGAMGVLPKQVAPADVSKVLQQLHLTDDAMTEEMEIPVAANLGTGSFALPQGVIAAAPAPPLPAETLLRDQVAELRRFMVTSLDQQSERILEDVRVLLRDAAPPVAPPAPVIEPPKPRKLPWMLAVAAIVAALILAVLLWQASVERQQLQAQIAQLSQAVAVTGVASQLAADAAVVTSDAIAPVTVVQVPFGETPLGGARIAQLRGLVQSIAQKQLKGTVEVRRHTGRFCLSGNGREGYSLAEAAVPYIQCDLVADASDPVLGAGPPESMDFAAALAEIRRQYGNAIRVDVTIGTGTEVQRPYPDVGGEPPRVPTAGDWNAAAQANNRVELRWHPST